MKTIKGPAVFLAQFMDDKEPFNSLDGLCKWASNLGYKGIQIPTDPSLIDLEKAAASQTYCDEFKEKINSYGLEITELSTHLQGQFSQASWQDGTADHFPVPRLQVLRHSSHA